VDKTSKSAREDTGAHEGIKGTPDSFIRVKCGPMPDE
jgi:hypothetical protein